MKTNEWKKVYFHNSLFCLVSTFPPLFCVLLLISYNHTSFKCIHYEDVTIVSWVNLLGYMGLVDSQQSRHFSIVTMRS